MLSFYKLFYAIIYDGLTRKGRFWFFQLHLFSINIHLFQYGLFLFTKSIINKLNPTLKKIA